MHMKATKVTGPKVVPIRFILEEPKSLTGNDLKEIDLKAAIGQSVLEVALDNNINIEHACGGVTACSTCHVYVEQGEELTNEPEDEELDRVDEAPAARINSRLSCQCRIQRPGQLVIKVPAWNRNAVKEVPH